MIFFKHLLRTDPIYVDNNNHILNGLIEFTSLNFVRHFHERKKCNFLPKTTTMQGKSFLPQRHASHSHLFYTGINSVKRIIQAQHVTVHFTYVPTDLFNFIKAK